MAKYTIVKGGVLSRTEGEGEKIERKNYMRGDVIELSADEAKGMLKSGRVVPLGSEPKPSEDITSVETHEKPNETKATVVNERKR